MEWGKSPRWYQRLTYHYKNHFFDDVRVIVSSYDLIKYQFNLPSDLSEDLGTDSDWTNLAKEIIKDGSFENACCSMFSINKYSFTLFNRWNQIDSFQKWLLWLWTRLQQAKSYAVECAQGCRSPAEFIDELYCGIMQHLREANFEQLYYERKAILGYLQSVPNERFWEDISCFGKTDSLACLTCLTDIERKAIFEIISDVDFENRGIVLPILKFVYPKLYFYLNNDMLPNRANLSTAHEQYFAEYKWLKATDTITDTFVRTVQTIALEKGASVFEMQPRNHFVTEHYDGNTIILFVDGMGAEYIDYLAYLFSDFDEQQYAITFEAGFCTLPSVTEINKDFMKGRNTADPPIRDLDELKHASNVYPDSLIKQFGILDELKSRVLSSLSGSINRVIISSDHGTSRMAVKVRNTEFDHAIPKPDDRVIYKYGRFCEGTQDEPKYPTAISYNDRLIFADYTRFVQNGTPIDEIHGGASLEEWLVPIITIEKLGMMAHQNVAVKPVKTIYRPELGTKQVRVVFTISGMPKESVTARINGTSFKCQRDEDTYSFVFSPSKTDSVLSVTIHDGGILGRFEIQIEQGIKKNASFDI